MSSLSFGCFIVVRFARLSKEISSKCYFHRSLHWTFASSSRRISLPFIIESDRKPRPKTIEDLVTPVQVISSTSTSIENDPNLLDGLAGAVSKKDIMFLVNEFARRPDIRSLAEEQGVTKKLFSEAFRSFRSHCLANPFQPELQVIMHDICHQVRNVTDIFPYFLKHAKLVFPHLECIDDLRAISDLTKPQNWYPEARDIDRKIVFHAGPTNSGKTYAALKRFYAAKSGIYCGPLKLLATEVFHKTNSAGTPCDLVTGEERRFIVDNEHPSSHITCTVEMLSTSMRVEVAIIDEIQMLRNHQRGWAWTRALLGVAADEVHVCGETSAISMVEELMESTKEVVEIRHYERKTPLEVMKHGLGSYETIQKGDCLVCFSKSSIFEASRRLEKLGVKTAMIYGDLPPGTKLSQAARFNDPNGDTDVLVATDAIGMGINLSINRVIFHSLAKPTADNAGQISMQPISTSQALQIAGRAGRFGTEYQHGKVTTLGKKDIATLQEILSQPVEPIKTVGIMPTFDQLEMFSYRLPQASLSNLLDIFISLSKVDDSKYFICLIDQIKQLAELINHINLPLKARYTFCLAPMNVSSSAFATNCFVSLARRYSSGLPLTFDWMCNLVHWPLSPPTSMAELSHMEETFDVLDLYRWLGIRFQDMFPDTESVRLMQEELDRRIEAGISNINDFIKQHLEDDDKENKSPKKVPQKLIKEVMQEPIKKATVFSKRKSQRKVLKSPTEMALEGGMVTKEQLEMIKAEIRTEFLAEKKMSSELTSKSSC